MQHLDAFFKATAKTCLAPFHHQLRQTLAQQGEHGDAGSWQAALAANLTYCQEPVESWDFAADTIRIGDESSPLLPDDLIMALHPWRKGPFMLRGTFIDTEWRSDWKWQRLSPHISNLEGRRVLDVGCGNGYHLFRMLGEGASLALGVDPTMIFNYQFRMLQAHLPANQAWLLPLRGEQLPACNCLDTVFSMGVLHHRRSPLDHLAELLSFLRPGGELVLETLVIEGDDQAVLLPRGRYAMMGNVYFIPTTQLLEAMLAKLGFQHIRTVDTSHTSTDEQRATAWMRFRSLADYLDPNNPARTLEGYPAPVRAIVIAEKSQ